MSTYLINIVANSNFAAVISRDTEATLANAAALEANSVALAENTAATEGVELSRKKLIRSTAEHETSSTSLLTRIRSLTEHLKRLTGAQDRVGVNFMGLSVRIGMWIIPALVLMTSTLFPLIAGLLAVGAAAGIAGGGLVLALGLGAVLMSHRMNAGGPLNQPEGLVSGGTQTSIFTTLLKPMWEMLDSPQLKGVTDNAVMFVKALFGDTIPNALRSFLTNIDPGTMMVIEQMFSRWLPEAATGLATWGSKIFNLIGTGSLARLNSFFEYLAGGIENAATWLDSGGGWNQLDNVSAIIGDIISTMMELGKSALPTFVAALNQIWPNPLKKMLEVMTTFFQEIGKNPAAMDSLVDIAQLVAVILTAAFALSLLSTILSAIVSTAGLVIAFLTLAVAVGYVFGCILIEIVQRLFWFGDAALTFFIDLMKSILDALYSIVHGGEFKSSIGNQSKYIDLAYGTGTEERAKLDRYWAGATDTAKGGWALGAAGAHTLRILIEPNGTVVDAYADEQANKKLGTNVSWDVANGQFSRGASV